MSIVSAYAKALGQLSDPRARSVVWLGIALAAAVFVLLWLGVGWLIRDTTLFDDTWLDTVVDVLGGFAILIITWFLFPPVVSACSSLFLERVAEAVERRHYPGLPPPRDVAILETVWMTVRLLVVMVTLNLVVLLFLLVPPVFPFVYYGMNGYLLGREYFEVVAARRLDPRAVRAHRHRNRGDLFLAGLVIALLLTVPVVNLLAPVIGTAAMVHLFQSRSGQQA
jgi:CysZ protein